MSHTPVLWAQRSSEDEESKNVLLITIEVPELESGYTLDFPEDGSKLVFKGKSKAYPSAGHTEEAKEYSLDIELFDKVVPDSVKTSLSGKNLYVVVPKKELKTEYWPRLTKDKKKLPYVKTDFSKWVDEDEQEAAEDLDSGMDNGMGGMPMGAGGMPGMGGGMGGGAGGMGGMDMEALMKQMQGGMGGAGGAGGAGGLDMASLMAQMGQGGAGGMPDFGAGGDGDDDDDDDGDMPALEETNPEKTTPSSVVNDAKGKGKSQEDDMPPLEDA